MIIKDETTLTQPQWDDLLAKRTDAIYRVKAYRWMPEYSEDLALAPSADNSMFDIIEHRNTLYAITYDLVKFLNGVTWTAVTGFTPHSNVIDTCPYSLISDNNDLHVFTLTSSGISRNIHNGTTWSGWDDFTFDSDIIFMAATDKFTVHYVNRNSTDHNYELKTVFYSGIDWADESSGIFWPFEVTSFDAIKFGDRDIIAMSTHVPGAISAKYLNNKVVKYALDAGGIVGFSYRNHTWSDHYEIDILDEIHSWRNRMSVRLSLVEEKLWLSSYSQNGIEDHSFDFYRFYQSSDGRHWSHGEYFPIPYSNRKGFVLAHLGTSSYVMQSDSILKSDNTLLFGTPSSQNILDITEYILEMSISRQDMQQLSFLVNNESGWIQTSLLDGSATLMMTIELGYWLDDEQVYVQTGIFEADAISKDEDLPNNMVSYAARDWMAWMNTKYQAEQFQFWIPQTIGGDDYTDDTGTGYGGMAHSAITTGSWKTEGNQLVLRDNDKEGIVLSTFVTDCWNGQFSIGVNPSHASNNEVYGILFRAQDKDNTYIYRYQQSDDKLHLVKRSGGAESVLWSSTTLSKAASTSKFYLMIEFYYCRITMYLSNDGISWTVMSQEVIPGLDPAAEVIQSGLVGILGKGFSDDTWDSDPGSIPPVDFPIDPAPPAISGIWAGVADIAIPNYDGYVYLIDRATHAVSRYSLVAKGMLGTNVLAFVPDPQSPLYLNTGVNVNGLLCSSTHAYYVVGIQSQATCTLTRQYAFRKTVYFRQRWCQANRNQPGFFAVCSHEDDDDADVDVTLDYGQNWTRTQDLGGAFGAGAGDDAFAAIHLDEQHTNWIEVALVSPSDEHFIQIYRSTNAGSSWATFGSPVRGGAQALLRPYDETDGANCYLGMIGADPGADFYAHSVKVTVSGATDIAAPQPYAGINYGPLGLFGLKFYDLNGDIGLLVGYHGRSGLLGVWKTLDRCVNYTSLIAPTLIGGSYPVQGNIAGDNAQVLFLWGDAGYFKISMDQGDSWIDYTADILAAYPTASMLINICGVG